MTTKTTTCFSPRLRARSRLLLVVLVLSVFLPAGTGLFCGVPQKIIAGEKGQKAIKLLDELRHPLFAINAASISIEEGVSGGGIEEFVAAIDAADELVEEFYVVAQYNRDLHRSVARFKEEYERWADRLRSHYLGWEVGHHGVGEAGGYHVEAVRSFVGILHLLEASESPIYRDIDEGRSATRLAGLLFSVIILALIVTFISQIIVKNKKLNIARGKLEAEIATRIEVQEKMDLIVDKIPGVIYACRYEGGAFVPEYCTANIAGLMGYTAADFYENENLWLANIHPDDSVAVFANYESLFVNDRLLHRYRWKHKDGHYIWVRDELALLRDDAGEPDQIVGVWVVIDEQKAIEAERDRYRAELESLVEEKTQALEVVQAELVQKERLAILGQLATTVSHELRNPLGTISNLIEIIGYSAGGEGDDEVRKMLVLALRNVERCDRIINELLEFTHGIEPRLESVVFDDWLDSHLNETCWPEDVTCARSLAADVRVNLDLPLLDRAVNNVVNNAIQALQVENAGEKKVAISTKIDKGSVWLSINDNGPGMTEECLQQIFNPLYSTKTFGVGLGLPIVKNAVESLDGTIDIDSRTGSGTTVVMEFPIKNGAGASSSC